MLEKRPRSRRPREDIDGLPDLDDPRVVTPSDRLSPSEYQAALRHVLRFRDQPVLPDPLATAVKVIEENPAFTQSRLLTRILVGLTYDQGEFRRAEVDAMDAGTCAMAISLMDAFGAGTPGREAWEGAVATARAAELAAEQ